MIKTKGIVYDFYYLIAISLLSLMSRNIAVGREWRARERANARAWNV